MPEGGVKKGSECSELVFLMAWLEKLQLPFWCLWECSHSSGLLCTLSQDLWNHPDLTGACSYDEKCQQGTASLFLQHRADTWNKALPAAKLSSQLNKNKRKSICLVLHPKSYLISFWPIFIYCVRRHWTTQHSKSLQSSYFMFMYSWKMQEYICFMYFWEKNNH